MARINGAANFTIANAATVSDAVGIGQYRQGSVTIPGTFTGTTLAFHVSNTPAGTYKAVEVEGEETNPVTVAAGTSYRIPISVFSYAYMKVVSGSAESGARTITGFFTS
jgi:hypothetical protein